MYKGWEDGSILDIEGTTSEYQLNVAGFLTECIAHNAQEEELKEHIQKALDASGHNGAASVSRLTSEIMAPNGFVFFVKFYDTGNLPTMVPIYSVDSTGDCEQSFDDRKYSRASKSYLKTCNPTSSCRCSVERK